MEERKYCIYYHKNKINNKIYVGQSCNPQKRWGKNGYGYKDSPLFYNAIQKYGWDNFEHKILINNLTLQEANALEYYFIHVFYKSDNKENGYNILSGGANRVKDYWDNEEYRNKMIQSFKIARQRDWSNPDFKNQMEQKLIAGLQEKWADPVYRENRINKDFLNENNPNSKSVINIETNKIFPTIKEASQWAGLKSISGIGQCCRGNKKTCGKHPETGESLHWKFADDTISNDIILKQAQSFNKVQVICINNNQIFESMSAAARWCGLNDKGKSINACCIGMQKTAGYMPGTNERLQWKYYQRGGGVI